MGKQWLAAGFVPGYSGGTVPDYASNRLPFQALSGTHRKKFYCFVTQYANTSVRARQSENRMRRRASENLAGEEGFHKIPYWPHLDVAEPIGS